VTDNKMQEQNLAHWQLPVLIEGPTLCEVLEISRCPQSHFTTYIPDWRGAGSEGSAGSEKYLQLGFEISRSKVNSKLSAWDRLICSSRYICNK